jgi:hypothetical protein
MGGNRQADEHHVEDRGARVGRIAVAPGPGRLLPAPGGERTLRGARARRYERRGPLLGPAAEQQVVQFPPDALPPPGGPHKQFGQRERAPRVLGRDVGGQRRGQSPPPGRRRSQRPAGRVADQVAAVPRLREREAGLPPPHQGGPPRGRRVGAAVDLSGEREQVVFPCGRAAAVKQQVGNAGGVQRAVPPVSSRRRRRT